MLMTDLLCNQLSRNKNKENEKITNEKKLLILLPLHRDNVTTYLATILGNFSLKATDSIIQFIEIFNHLTKFEYDEDFHNYLNGDVSYLCSVSLVIPVQVQITSIEKNVYSLRLLNLNLPTLRSLIITFLAVKKKRNFFLFYKFYIFLNDSIKQNVTSYKQFRLKLVGDIRSF